MIEIVGKWDEIKNSVLQVLEEKCDFWGEGMGRKIDKLVKSSRFGRVRFVIIFKGDLKEWVRCWWIRGKGCKNVRVEIDDSVDVKKVVWVDIGEETSRQKMISQAYFYSNLVQHAVMIGVKYGSRALDMIKGLGIQVPDTVVEVIDIDEEFELAVVAKYVGAGGIYLCSRFGYWVVDSDVVCEQRPVRYALIAISDDYWFKKVDKEEIDEFLMQKAMVEVFGGDEK